MKINKIEGLFIINKKASFDWIVEQSLSNYSIKILETH